MTLAHIASSCEFNYGAMSRVGYLYDSAKDQVKWHGLSVKKYIKMVMKIGQIVVLKDEDYQKEKVKAVKSSNTDIASALIAAFGDGT